MAKILVVEDDKSTRLLMAEILRKNGYEVMEAPSGANALNLLEEEGELPAVIVLDVMMPFMDGLEFARRIREDPAKKGIPIILCTALRDRNTVMRAAKLGINRYILKPYEAEKVLEQVRSAMAAPADAAAK